MSLKSILVGLLGLGTSLWLLPASGAEMTMVSRAVQSDQGRICRTAAAAAEAALHVPDAFLSAIAKVESGRQDPSTGLLAAWPWTVNAEGAGSFYASKAEAVAAVQALQARGVRSIDVGCLQVNLLHHPDAFASLDQAFDPAANAMYAAGFLVALLHQTGSWPLAAAAYHSQTPTLGAPYERRVLAEWATPDGQADQARQRTHSARPAAGRPEAPKEAEPAVAQAPSVQHAGGSWSPIGKPPVLGDKTLAETAPPAVRAAGQTGRSLAAYRLLPVRLANTLAGRHSF